MIFLFSISIATLNNFLSFEDLYWRRIWRASQVSSCFLTTRYYVLHAFLLMKDYFLQFVAKFSPVLIDSNVYILCFRNRDFDAIHASHCKHQWRCDVNFNIICWKSGGFDECYDTRCEEHFDEPRLDKRYQRSTLKPHISLKASKWKTFLHMIAKSLFSIFHVVKFDST